MIQSKSTLLIALTVLTAMTMEVGCGKQDTHAAIARNRKANGASLVCSKPTQDTTTALQKILDQIDSLKDSANQLPDGKLPDGSYEIQQLVTSFYYNHASCESFRTFNVSDASYANDKVSLSEATSFPAAGVMTNDTDAGQTVDGLVSFVSQGGNLVIDANTVTAPFKSQAGVKSVTDTVGDVVKNGADADAVSILKLLSQQAKSTDTTWAWYKLSDTEYRLYVEVISSKAADSGASNASPDKIHMFFFDYTFTPAAGSQNNASQKNSATPAAATTAPSTSPAAGASAATTNAAGSTTVPTSDDNSNQVTVTNN